LRTLANFIILSGVWIDPIDGTNEFISAKSSTSDHPNIAKSGLACVTVLIGVYDRKSNLPIFGVINQPFYGCTENSYKSKIYYGASIDGLNINNIPENNDKKGKIAIVSSSETRKQTLEEAGYTTIESSGAGYKILKVIKIHRFCRVCRYHE
jgi:inositol polyphosphate 1-phosphatase